MSVAVCFSGYHRVRPGRGIRQHLIEPLGADLLLALSYRRDDGCSSFDGCGARQRFVGALGPVARSSWELQPTVAELVSTLESLPHWPAVLAAFNSSRGSVQRAGCTRDTKWSRARSWTSPYRCPRLSHVNGNTIFAPVLGAPSLNVLHQFLAQSQCLALLSAHERAAGASFDRVVHSRLEFDWLAPHPPLSALDPSCVWTPSGSEYRGVNDRHALMSRAVAGLYFSRWQMLVDGRVMRTSDDLRRGSCCGAISSEIWLANILKAARLHVCLFPSVAFLGCCDRSLRGRCYQRKCLAAVDPADNATVHWGKCAPDHRVAPPPRGLCRPTAACSLPADFRPLVAARRYEEELSLAVRNSADLRRLRSPDSPHPFVLRGKLPWERLAGEGTAQPALELTKLDASARGRGARGAAAVTTPLVAPLQRVPLDGRRDVSFAKHRCRHFDANASSCERARVGSTPCEWVRGECRSSRVPWQAHLDIEAPPGFAWTGHVRMVSGSAAGAIASQRGERACRGHGCNSTAGL